MMKISYAAISTRGLLITSVFVASAIGAADVKTARRPVLETYHGIKVVDDFQWLENSASTGRLVRFTPSSGPAVSALWTIFAVTCTRLHTDPREASHSGVGHGGW